MRGALALEEYEGGGYEFCVNLSRVLVDWIEREDVDVPQISATLQQAKWPAPMAAASRSLPWTPAARDSLLLGKGDALMPYADSPAAVKAALFTLDWTPSAASSSLLLPRTPAINETLHNTRRLEGPDTKERFSAFAQQPLSFVAGATISEDLNLSPPGALVMVRVPPLSAPRGVVVQVRSSGADDDGGNNDNDDSAERECVVQLSDGRLKVVPARELVAAPVALARVFCPSRPNARAGANGGSRGDNGGGAKRSRNLAVPARVVGVMADGRCMVRFTDEPGSDLSAGGSGRADGWASAVGDVRARVEVLRTTDVNDPQKQVRFEDRIQGGRFSVGDAVQLDRSIAVLSGEDDASQSALVSGGGGASPVASRARLVDGRIVRVAMTVRSLFGSGGDISTPTPGATAYEAVRVQASDTAAPGGADPYTCAQAAAMFTGPDDSAGGAAEYRGLNDIEALGRRAKSLSRALESTELGIGKARTRM